MECREKDRDRKTKGSRKDGRDEADRRTEKTLFVESEGRSENDGSQELNSFGDGNKKRPIAVALLLILHDFL